MHMWGTRGGPQCMNAWESTVHACMGHTHLLLLLLLLLLQL